MSEISITEISAPERGCGLRQQGGFYMVGDQPMVVNLFFPKSLECKCGLQIVRPSRSCQSFLPGKIWPVLAEKNNGYGMHFPADKKAWALTIDVRSYPTIDSYLAEAKDMGISRRLNNGLPKGFRIGEDWAFLIHQRTLRVGDDYKPGFFLAFMPKQVQYVVAGDETPAYLKSLQDKGITLVSVPNSKPRK